MHAATLECDLTAAVARHVYVDRVRRCPHCFATDFLCEMWQARAPPLRRNDRDVRNAASHPIDCRARPLRQGDEDAKNASDVGHKFMINLVIDYDGLHLYCEDGVTHLCTFGFDAHKQWVVSWLCIGNLLVVTVIYHIEEEARLHATHQPSLLAKAQSRDEGGKSAPAVAQYAQKKLHLLSKEALVIKSLLKTYSDAVLGERVKYDKQQAAIAKAQAKVAERGIFTARKNNEADLEA